MVYKNNSEKGMTLLTTLFSLLIIIMTLPFISYFFKHVTVTNKYDDLSHQQFFHLIRDDILRASMVTVDNNILTFYLNNNDIAVLEHYDYMVRRQVNGVGHEVYLRDIQTFVLKPNSYGVAIELTSIKGEMSEKFIAFYNE